MNDKRPKVNYEETSKMLYDLEITSQKINVFINNVFSFLIFKIHNSNICTTILQGSWQIILQVRCHSLVCVCLEPSPSEGHTLQIL